MKINIVFNQIFPEYKDTLNQIEQILINNNVEFRTFNLNSMSDFGEISLVIGGDGTLLNVAKFYSKTKVPVLGINIGRLGFLSQGINIEEIIEKVLNKEYFVEERLMLESNNKLALNDFVIKGCNPSRTSKFFLEINDECICEYVADGLIISTPTGSTAYGLSAGGPIIYPTLNAMSIVPICPHTLNARPLVVPSTETILIKTSENNLSISTDGQIAENCVEKIKIVTSPQKAYLAFLRENSFYTVLKDKMHWGVSEAK